MDRKLFFSHLRTRSCIVALLCVAVVLGGSAQAEEGGSGHYSPGSMASFMDGVSPTETFLIRYNLLNYDGSVSAGLPLPIAGFSAAGADANVWGHGLTAFWRPPFELGEHWSYGMSATIPYLFADVSADVAVTGAGGNTTTVRRSDKTDDLGDIVLIPLMLNYNVNPDFNVNFRVTAYAPTGSFKVGRLANTGKNFWTIEPTVAFMYLGQKNGRELSVFMGMDFNEENDDTNYKSGTQAHVEATLAQHFPLGGGLVGVGLNGYWYEQVTGDSGSGATFGDFKAKTVGLGPVVSYASKFNGHDLIAEFKWLHETSVKNRLEGDTLFLKVLYKFY